jgi:hypothetical protein
VGGPVIAEALAPARAATAEPPFVRRIRVRARRRTLWLRQLWAMGLSDTGPEVDVTHRDADRLLTDPSLLTAAQESFYAADPLSAELNEHVREADAEALQDPVWRRLTTALGLSADDADLLALAVAAELQPELARLYGYLQDEAVPCLPSASLAATLFGWPAGAAARAGTGLVEWALARPVDPGAAPETTTGWVADRELVAWLATPAPEELPAAPEKVLYPAELAAMEEFVRAAWCDGPRPLELELVGVPGSGRGVLGAQLAERLGRTLLTSGRVESAEAAIRVARHARLSNACLYWRDADELEPAVLAAVRGRVDLVVLGVGSARGHAGLSILAASFELPGLDRAGRLALWASLSDAPVPVAVEELLSTPAEVAGAAALAGVTHATGPERRRLPLEPVELLTPLPCPYTWDDIVLSAPLEDHLREFEQQARWRWAVYEDWGFGRLVPLGRGVSALFAGPSGTGKTMAAQVLARELGLDLYRIDLAGVVNKYIGETEKRLKRVFDACERAGAILFFDEADALFGRRAQVKDAHDRYANIEIDYLLQRMERFDGIAVLATNRKEDLDRAFLRRLRFVVDFLRPGPKERLAIWGLSLHERAPSGEPLLDGIDFDALAKLPLTGAEIKTAALGAAFRARAESRRIRMDDVLAAARRELAKQGAELREGGR